METRIFHTLLSVPVHQTILSNGLTIMTAHTNSESIEARLVFSAGSMMDEIPGTAHFLEHILWEGPNRTGVHPKLRHLFPRGMTYGAAVGQQGSSYWAQASKKDLREALSGLFDVCSHPAIDQKSVDEERQPIQQEIDEHWRGEQYIRWEQPLLYPREKAFHHMPGGTFESVETITADDLITFHRMCYGAQNAALIVTGGITHEDVLGACFGGLADLLPPSGTTTRRRQSIDRPKIVDTIYTDDPSTSSIKLYWPADSSRDAPWLAHLPLALTLLTSAPFGLLRQSLRIQLRKIYGTHPFFSSWLNTISIKVRARPTEHPDIEREVHTAVAALGRNEFSQEAWETVISCHRRIIRERRCRERVTYSWAADALENHWLQGGPHDTDADAWILQSTREEVAAAAKLYLDPAQCGRIRSIAKRDQ